MPAQPESSPLSVEKPKPGLARWLAAFSNSYNGLLFGLKSEVAIREELLLFVVSIPLAFLLTDSSAWRLAMIFSVAMVLVVELLNSALEATLDLLHESYHPLAKGAKDMGSLAVLISLLAAVAVWVVAVVYS
ncbi:MAG: diacylglycerol kinase [Pseudomonadales bacterium]